MVTTTDTSLDGVPPESSPEPESKRRLPLFLWLLVGYLVTDAIIRFVLLGIDWGERRGSEWRLTRDQAWDVTFGIFYLLLAFQVLIRTVAARFALTIVFTLQIVLFISRYAVMDPELWWSARTATRIQELGQVVFCTIAIVLLNRAPVRDHLKL